MHLPMDGWVFKDGGYWEMSVPKADNSSVVCLAIYIVDSFTEGECARYGLKFDPDAGFVLYAEHSGKAPEFVPVSLHYYLVQAMNAGHSWLETFQSRVRCGRYE